MPADLWIDKYDSVSVAEYTSFYLLSIGVYEAVTVTEYYRTDQIPVDVYDAVSVAEDVTVNVVYCWKLADDEYIPFPRIAAEFNPTLQLDSRLPAWTGTGQMGFVLDERMPVRSLSAAMSQASVSMSLDSKLPTWASSGQFGFSMESKMPVWEIDSEGFVSGYFYLDRKIPLHKISATMYETGVMSLDKKIPVWTLTGSLDITEEVWVVASKLPLHKVTGTMYESSGWALAEDLPMWTLDGTIYTGGMTLDVSIPVWMMEAGLEETEPSGSPDDPVTQSYFSGVLRYVRP